MIGLATLFGTLIFISSQNKISALETLNPSGAGISVIYSSIGEEKIKITKITPNIVGLNREVSLFGDPNLEYYEKDLHLSPNRLFIAITAQPYKGHGDVVTYISDLNGNILTEPSFGNFRSWSPDSEKVLLFRSETDNTLGRQIYILETNGSYYDSGLPIGTIDSAISPLDNSFVYSIASENSSEIWLRNSRKDILIFKVDNRSVLGHLAWSPDGKKIAFLRSDTKSKVGDLERQLWIMNSDGTDSQKIDGNVLWNYSPVWSPDGTRILFSKQEGNDQNSVYIAHKDIKSNLWEFQVKSNSLIKLTNLNDKRVLYPTYSTDGKAIVFTNNQSGQDEVWALVNGESIQLTNDGLQKAYPVIP